MQIGDGSLSLLTAASLQRHGEMLSRHARCLSSLPSRKPDRVCRALRFKKPEGGVLSLPQPFTVFAHHLNGGEPWKKNYHHREQHSTYCICFAKAHTQYNFHSYNGPFNLIIEFNSEEVPMSLQKEIHPQSKAFQYADDVNASMDSSSRNVLKWQQSLYVLCKSFHRHTDEVV